MNTAIELGSCLYIIVAVALVSYGIWRARGAATLSSLYHLFVRPAHMSTPQAAENNAIPDPVPVPVPGTSTENLVPPVSLDIIVYAPDEDIIRAVANLHINSNPASDYRFSQNAIHRLMGGNKADCDAAVKAAREFVQREYYSDMQQRIEKEVRNNARKGNEGNYPDAT